MTEANDSFFEIHANDYYYGDKKELPKSLQREIHENMLYWVAHLHPNQKYTTENYDLSRRATDTALKYINALRDQLSKEREEKEKLQAFKDYVHKRLDDAGVATDPDSPHKAAGCRIGGRLDLVLQDREMRKELVKVTKELVKIAKAFQSEIWEKKRLPSNTQTVIDNGETAISKATELDKNLKAGTG